MALVIPAGAKLFPARWKKKRDGTFAHQPLIKWGAASSADESQWREWLAMPDVYLCINLRESGLVVVDLDLKHGQNGAERLAEWEAAHQLTLPRLLVVRTPGGGLHVYFNGDCATKIGALPGVDCPAMVPVPGSVVPGKGEYVVCDFGL